MAPESTSRAVVLLSAPTSNLRYEFDVLTNECFKDGLCQALTDSRANRTLYLLPAKATSLGIFPILPWLLGVLHTVHAYLGAVLRSDV